MEKNSILGENEVNIADWNKMRINRLGKSNQIYNKDLEVAVYYSVFNQL